MGGNPVFMLSQEADMGQETAGGPIPSGAERFQGCLLGLMVGDALGARFEGWAPEDIAAEYATREALLNEPPPGPWRYTDDTEMTIGIAEALLKDGEIIADSLRDAWVANFTPGRCYGATQLVLRAMRDGEDYREVAENLFPGGSYGNGGAMRVAPVGLFFQDDWDRLWQQAELCTQPTHAHRLAIEGAQLVALAVAMAASDVDFDRAALLTELKRRCRSDEYRDRLDLARRIGSRNELHRLGNGVPALESAVTAIACFALSPESYVDAIADAIFLGGDTDTIAAMAGAISGARLGFRAIPSTLLDNVEREGKGREYVADLAVRLHGAYQAHRPDYPCMHH
jgi:poly(ADP-ribose) glycohydrolase ARH3